MATSKKLRDSMTKYRLNLTALLLLQSLPSLVLYRNYKGLFVND